MSVSLSLFAGAGWQFFDNNGNILSGGKLYTYIAGTTTAVASYTSSSGIVAHTNPIVLDSAGRVPSEIWLTSGTNYKFVLKTSTDVTIGTYDNIKSAATSLDGTGTNNGVAYFNSVGAFSSGNNLTFNSSTSALAVGGNITSKNILANGSITASGNLSGVNLVATGTATISSATTINGTLNVGGTISSSSGITGSTPAVTQAVTDNSTKIATTAFVQAIGQLSKIQPLTAVINANQLVITLAPTSLNFRNANLANGAVEILSNSTNLTLTLPAAGNLGAASNVSARLVVLAVKNGSNMELAITNLTGGLQLDESNVISTSSAAATAITSIYCASNLANTVYRVVGFIDATYLSSIPGWSSISKVQGGSAYPTAPLTQQIAKAWVNFNGTNGAVRTSYNIASVTRGSTANYTINFSTAMPNIDYCAVFGAGYPGASACWLCLGATPTTTSLSVTVRRDGYTEVRADQDSLYTYIAVFEN